VRRFRFLRFKTTCELEGQREHARELIESLHTLHSCSYACDGTAGAAEVEAANEDEMDVVGGAWLPAERVGAKALILRVLLSLPEVEAARRVRKRKSTFDSLNFRQFSRYAGKRDGAKQRSCTLERRNQAVKSLGGEGEGRELRYIDDEDRKNEERRKCLHLRGEKEKGM
jgi:hypothetical protein